MNKLCIWSLILAFFAAFAPAQQNKSRSSRNESLPSANKLALSEHWSLQSSCKVDQKGEVLSTPKFQPRGWYDVSVPTTVFAALVKHKVYPDPGFGMNLRSVPGVTYPIGTNFSNIAMQQDSPYLVPWWYRKEFVLPASYRGKSIWLQFGGINDDVFDALPFPGVGHVNQLVAGLDYGGVREFARLVFKDEGRLPVFTVLGYGHVQARARSRAVIVQ